MPLIARYAEILRGTGAAAPLLASVVGRLSLGMTGLALLLLIRDGTGSYAAAGAVTAAYAVAFALAAPSRARSADRSGPVRVIGAMALLHPACLVLVVLAVQRDAPLPVLLLTALLAGATVPPLGSVMRALWGVLVSGERLTTAYALESILIEVCFLGGPLMVGFLSAVFGPASAVLVSAALTLLGGVSLALTPTLRAVRPVSDTEHALLGPLVDPVVRGLLRGVAAIGICFGAIEVAVTAFAQEEGGGAALTGVLLAVWSVGSVAGGLVYGGIRLPYPHHTQLPILVGALALGTVLPLLAHSPAWMGVALLLQGVTIAPFSTANSVLLGAAAPRGTVTEAFAWSSSMIFGGAAIGYAGAGLLVEHVGVTAAFGLATVGGVVATVSTIGAVRRIAGRAGVAQATTTEGTLE
ncbi:MAG TPA: MFS transporter [Mycobacteriales bacterium]|nr:MFS transporter [Mycobacteriales bacterium]